MTPIQAAKMHCCNYQSDDGTCIGVAYDDKLRPYQLFPEGSKCVLRNCEKCVWFEETVIPQVPEVAEEYRKSLPPELRTTVRPGGHIKRVCQECQKTEVGPRKRYCEKCGKTRKRASTRHSKQKRGI